LAAEALENPYLWETVQQALIAYPEGAESPDEFAQRATDLGALAERHPRFLQLQILAMRLSGQAGQIDEVSKLAQKARLNFPTQPMPSRIAAQAFATKGQFGQAIDAAREWVERSEADQPGARVLIAECLLRDGKAALAVEELAEDIPAAMEAPVENQAVLVVYANALLMSGKAEEVEALLLDRIGSDEFCRQLWLGLAIAPKEDPRVTSRWLAEAEARIPDPTIPERMQLALGWSRLAEQAKAASNPAARDACIQKLKGILADLEKTPDLTAVQWFQIGAWREFLAEIYAAARAYRKALEIDPELSLAQNNLAMMLARDRKYEEALALAREIVDRAIKDQAPPAQTAEFRDTLAQVYRMQGDYTEAIAEIEACRQLQAGNPRWPITLLEIFAQAGVFVQAGVEGERVKELLRELELHPNRPFSADLERRLEAARKALGER
jgi:tetratricopeptide (TPR) repeat protein